MVCADDEEVIERARSLFKDSHIEVWSGPRLVIGRSFGRVLVKVRHQKPMKLGQGRRRRSRFGRSFSIVSQAAAAASKVLSCEPMILIAPRLSWIGRHDARYPPSVRP